MLAVPDGEAGHVVFGELVNERAGDDEIEEGIQLCTDRIVLPRAAPINRRNFDVLDQRAAAVSECGEAAAPTILRGFFDETMFLIIQGLLISCLAVRMPCEHAEPGW